MHYSTCRKPGFSQNWTLDGNDQQRAPIVVMFGASSLASLGFSIHEPLQLIKEQAIAAEGRGEK